MRLECITEIIAVEKTILRIATERTRLKKSWKQIKADGLRDLLSLGISIVKNFGSINTPQVAI